MNITRATLEDAQEILALQKLAFGTEAEFYNNWSIPPLAETLEEMQSKFARLTFLKAVDGSAIVGSVRASVVDGVCHIERLVVHTGYRRKGIARALMTAIESEFSAAERFELFTGAESKGSLRLYRGLGYVPCSVERPPNQVTLVHLVKKG